MHLSGLGDPHSNFSSVAALLLPACVCGTALGPCLCPAAGGLDGSACSPALPWVFLAFCVAAASFLQEPEGLDTDTERTDLKEAITTTAAVGPRDAWGPPPTVLQDKAILGPCGWVAPHFNLVLMCPFPPEPPCALSPVSVDVQGSVLGSLCPICPPAGGNIADVGRKQSGARLDTHFPLSWHLCP